MGESSPEQGWRAAVLLELERLGRPVWPCSVHELEREMHRTEARLQTVFVKRKENGTAAARKPNPSPKCTEARLPQAARMGYDGAVNAHPKV